ncbi:MAG: BrnT family toxin [Catonella sp.]|nr:BrnT family toxin [Catonella sp.]MDY6355713.1 BrnT family toxin [Catonella sp.]
MLSFEWDDNKNKINIKKHGISFEEARTVFFDDYAILFDDPEHSDTEDRFLLIVMSDTANICIVCHCYRESDAVVRIISARKATKKEADVYVRGI